MDITTDPLPTHLVSGPRTASGRTRDLLELILGYALIVGIIWSPEHLQSILTPIALVATLSVVLVRGRSRDELGMGRRGLVRSFWILPAALALTFVSTFVAAKIGTLHPLYKPDAAHVGGYILWTIYQQFLLQDYFLDRLLRLVANQTSAIGIAGMMFAGAHVPSPWLTLATLAWGIISCGLFRRYRNLWMLGVAQGLLGLAFAICVPDALHHHLRVGLGYLKYRPMPPAK